MSKINHRRKNKIKEPKQDHFVDLDAIYDRTKEKEQWKRNIKKYIQK